MDRLALIVKAIYLARGYDGKYDNVDFLILFIEEQIRLLKEGK